MFHGVLALLERTLRTDSRSLLIHASRAGGAILLVLSLSMRFGFVADSGFGAPGLRMLRTIAILNSMFLILLSIGLFSTAISEEKEAGTLGLLRLAGINALGFLIGKMGGRLFQVLLLIAVQLPIAMLAVTLGGVTAKQVLGVFIGMGTVTLFMAGVGLLCSTIASNNRNASTCMVVALIAYFCIPQMSLALEHRLLSNAVLTPTSVWIGGLQLVGSLCLFQEIILHLRSSYAETLWSGAVAWNLAGGAMCFLLSWTLFNTCSVASASDRSSSLLIRLRHGFRTHLQGRPRWNPYFWKDFHFVAGGIPGLICRVAIYAALLPGSFLMSLAFSGRPSTIWWDNPSTLLMYQVLLLQAVTIENAQLASRSIYEELSEHTMSQLCLLPVSTSMICYSKIAGAFVAVLPAICCLALVSFCTAEGRLETASFCGGARGWFYLSHCLLVPHLAAVLASYVRMGFVSLATGGSLCVMFCWIGAFQGTRFLPDEPVLWLAVWTIAAACLICQFWVVRRIQILAAVG